MTGADTGSQLPASMIERMTLIIDTIGGGSARLTVDALVRRTGLPRSTLRRILDQLVALGWVTAHPDGYGVGRRLGGGVAEDRGHADVRAAAAGHLHRLHVSTGLVAHLARHTRSDVFYLDKVGGRDADKVPSRVGGRAPLHATALGKAIAAWWEPEEVDALAATGLVRLTRRTITDLPTLHEELARVRAMRGVAYADGEHTEPIACVAAAIRSPGGAPVASISLAGPDVGALEKCAPLVLDASRRVSGELFSSLRNRQDKLEATETPGTSWTPRMLGQMMERGSYDWI